MKSNYRLLILDYGGVYSFPYTADNFDKIMLKVFGRVPNKKERQLISDVSYMLGKNAITTEEYISAVGRILRISKLPTVGEFENATIEVTNPPTPEMVNLVEHVRGKGVKVSLLSDMYMFEVERTRSWGRYDGFDYVAFSAEAGVTKRDERFFEGTLSFF